METSHFPQEDNLQEVNHLLAEYAWFVLWKPMNQKESDEKKMMLLQLTNELQSRNISASDIGDAIQLERERKEARQNRLLVATGSPNTQTKEITSESEQTQRGILKKVLQHLGV